MQIYITKNGNQTGPFTEEQVRSMISADMISHDDLAWIEGAPDWTPLSTILGISPSPPPIPNLVSSVRAEQPLNKLSDGPTGIGGWLVFFCVGLTILSPLFSLAQMVGGWEQAEPAFSRFPTIKSVLIWENLGTSVILIYAFIVGCMIWSGNPQGRAIARRFLLIRLFGFIGIEIIAIVMIRDLPSEIITAGIGGVVGALFREGLYFTLWWFYFKKSKRVRNTYGHE